LTKKCLDPARRMTRGMGLFHPPAHLKGRQRLPLCLVMIAISVAMMCSLPRAQFAFTSQPHTVGDNVRISLGSAQQSLSSTTRFVGSASVRGHVQLGTSCGEAAMTSWSFRSGCMLLLSAATAGIALSPKRRHGWQSAKARRAVAKCSVACFGADALPGAIASSVLYTQGSASSAAPATSFPTSVTSTAPRILEQQHALPESEPMSPAIGAVAVLHVPVHHGLSSIGSTIHLGTTHRACRRGGVGGRMPRASPSGRSRSARRAVGARLQPKCETPAVPQAAWDPTRLRTQLQVGFQVVRRNGQQRSFQQLSTCSGIVDLSRVQPLSLLNAHSNKS